VKSTTLGSSADHVAGSSIHEYLEAVDKAMQSAGASNHERAHVLENVRTQIAEMLDDRFAGMEISDAHIRSLLQELDPPEAYGRGYLGSPGEIPQDVARQTAVEFSSTPATDEMAPRPPRWSRVQMIDAGARVTFTIFGVLLPLFALIFEGCTRWCSQELFDPIPTWAHVACVALVPAIYLVGLLLVVRNVVRFPRTQLFAVGVATGISLLYSLPFLPMAPFALIGIIYLGFGLLPLSPIISYVCGLWLKRKLRLQLLENQVQPRPYFFWLGILGGVLLTALCYLPAYVTYSSIHDAARESGAPRAAALQRLRWLHAEDEVLRLAYAARRRTGDIGLGPWGIFWSGENANAREDARIVYYSLTGQPFNAVRPPAITRGWLSSGADLEREPGMRDGTVGWIDKSLALRESRIDSIADAPSATGYVEWTMAFHNSGTDQREARAQILLPPGGVVSRLTLWVNGEEREAAFATRGAVQQAYDSVVARRRDPVLVTTAGPDRILMQCFPVPVNGDIKIRIGITHPLPVTGERERVRLPKFLERNFDISETTKHSLWVEAVGQLESGAGKLKPTVSGSGLTRLAGELSESDLQNSGDILMAAVAPASGRFADPASDKHTIEQRVTELKPEVPATLFLVLDTSAASSAHLEQLAAACRNLPATMQVRLVRTEDRGATGADKELSVRDLNSELEHTTCGGGQDNIPALRLAWQAAAGIPGSAIVWVHSAQSVQMEGTASLLQLIQRSGKTSPDFYEVLLSAGADRIVGDLERDVNIQALAGVGAAAISALSEKFQQWRDGTPQHVVVRERRELAAGEQASTSTRASGHVARLWAFAEVKRLLRDKRAVAQAVDLAAKYQLVTPVTGAVVLESQEQFQSAGLKPVEPGTVPTIPEPEEWALIIVVAGLLAFAAWKLRRRGMGRFAV
jgi:hypothetical protein